MQQFFEIEIEIEHECEPPDVDDESNWTRSDIRWGVLDSDTTYDTRDEALDAAGERPDNLTASWDESSEPEYELQSSDVETTDGSQTTDRRGKRITNPRYMERLLGAEVTATGGRAFHQGQHSHFRLRSAKAIDADLRVRAHLQRERFCRSLASRLHHCSAVDASPSLCSSPSA
jgi:hypothetical protein